MQRQCHNLLHGAIIVATPTAALSTAAQQPDTKLSIFRYHLRLSRCLISTFSVSTNTFSSTTVVQSWISVRCGGYDPATNGAAHLSFVRTSTVAARRNDVPERRESQQSEHHQQRFLGHQHGGSTTTLTNAIASAVNIPDLREGRLRIIADGAKRLAREPDCQRFGRKQRQ